MSASMADHVGMSSEVLLYLASSAALKMAFSYLTSRNRPPHAEKVGVVSSVMLYPVKSMKGISLKQAKCTHAGLYADNVGDRSFVVTYGPSYRFITARQEPTLMLVSPSVRENYLFLEAPNISTLKVDMDESLNGKTIAETKIWGEPIEGVDCGDEAADWLCKYFGKPGFRLLFHSPQLPSRTIQDGPTEYHKKAKPNDKIGFQDCCHFHLASESSLADLNKRLTTPVDMRRFRPNFVIKNEKDIPFDEDKWVEIYIGQCKFTTVVQTDRCNQLTVIPDEGVKDIQKQPLKELQSYRILPGIAKHSPKSPFLGTWLLTDWPGQVKEGDPVYAIRGSLQ